MNVQVAAPLLSRSMPLVATNRNWVTVVAGINADYLVAREWQIASGRSFTSDEITSGTKVAIVGSVIVEELFNGRAGIGETFRIGSVPFTVIGVLDRKGLGAAGRSQDDVVFIPLSAAKSRVLGAVRGTTREALDFISIKVSDASAMPEIERELEALLRQRHRIRGDAPSDFRIENPADVLFARGAAVRLLGSLLIAVAAVSLVVGGISIMNIMLVSVTERTREIGLRMAVGASRRDIRWQFLIEALILALMGGLVGAISGAVAAVAIALKAGWPILISPWAIILACGFAAFIWPFPPGAAPSSARYPGGAIATCGFCSCRSPKIRIPTDLLLQHLLTLDDGRWTEFRGEHGNQAPKPLTRPTMTKMISVFGVRTKTLWPRHHNASAKSTRGYTRQDFERAWAAYCDDEGNTPTHLSIIKHLRRP